MSSGLELLLSGTDASSAARQAIAANSPSLSGALRDDLELLVTELVTNAVRHGGATSDRPLRLKLRRRAGRIRVEVLDPGSEFVSSRPTNGDSKGGWGLVLVDRIAARWGVCPLPSGKCVWFELPVEAVL
jgi:anti-sigma regulatory factor (Ser/Thr protein kinase)